MRAIAFTFSFALVAPIAAQQIYDIYATTWDRSQLFTYTNLGNNPINFVSPGSIGQADIAVVDSQIFQTIVGHGATLTDSSATLLNNLKNADAAAYWSILGYLFDPTDGNGGAGLSYLRVPLGASDFSASVYSYDDVSGDTSLNNFNINKAPTVVFSVINDIQGINRYLKVHLLPWSPPGWMKDSGSMNGGNFLNQYINVYANYLLKCLQGFQSHGIIAYAIGIQNEPENNNPTYPTCIVTASQEAQIGTALRTLMNNNGFANTKIIAYDHNWIDAGGYPVQVMEQAFNAFAGASFHCYQGEYTQQASFHDVFPSKEIYFTECSGTYGTDWWSDIKWYMDNLFIGTVEQNSMSVLMWNLALDGTGRPELPGSNSCSTPCRPLVTISGNSYSVNQEFYAMAQSAKAIVPKDVNGPFGQRIGVSVGGSLSWALRVGAFVTHRVNPSDWPRYSLVVLNWDDSASTTWNPQPVSATIEFRGMQARYTFPVGVTTLWWYAPNTSNGPVQLVHNITQPSVHLNNTSNASATFIPTPASTNATGSSSGSAPHFTASVTWSVPASTASGRDATSNSTSAFAATSSAPAR